MGTDLWQKLKAFNLFRLLQNETTEMLSMGKRSKNKHKFGRAKVCEAEDVRGYSIKPKMKNEVLASLSIKLFAVWISEIFHALPATIYCQK